MPRVIRKQPGRRVKRKSNNSESTAESPPKSNQFNMIGDLISNYGMTGENVAHQIFSQLDFSSLQQGQLVCKTWNRFLANDRNLILNLLMKTKPYLEYLSKELSDSKGRYISKHPRGSPCSGINMYIIFGIFWIKKSFKKSPLQTFQLAQVRLVETWKVFILQYEIFCKNTKRRMYYLRRFISKKNISYFRKRCAVQNHLKKQTINYLPSREVAIFTKLI